MNKDVFKYKVWFSPTHVILSEVNASDYYEADLLINKKFSHKNIFKLELYQINDSKV